MKYWLQKVVVKLYIGDIDS